MVGWVGGCRPGSEGWEKGGKAGQDANINPLENLLNIRQKENHQFCTFQVSRWVFSFSSGLVFWLTQSGSSQTQGLTFSFAWISRSFLRASTWMWELTWAIQSKFSKNTSPGKNRCNAGNEYNSRETFLQIQFRVQIMSNGDLLACPSLAGSELDVPCYQLVPSWRMDV